MTRYVKRGGKMWIRVFPDKPITQKPLEVRKGTGKGNVEYWVANIQPGRMLFEIEGVDEDGHEAFRLAAAKLPFDHHFRETNGDVMEIKRTSGKVRSRAEEDLIDLQKDQFSLACRRATGQLAQSHRSRQVKQDIARVKTLISAESR